MSKVLGIDLGTTKSAVGIWDGGRPRILPSESGSQSIPSLVMVTPDEEIYAGLQAAKHPDRYNSKNITISSVKRMIGSKGETGWGWWKSYPQEVSSFILSELRQRAEGLLEDEASRAVIAIPSHFDEAQRRATKEAASIAGIEVLRLLNEATAAILAYGIARPSDETVVVFDLGGGTLDVSVAGIGGGLFEVKTIEGESNLGGDDFTQAIIDYVTDQVRKETGPEVAADAAHSLMLREAADKAKIDLSSSHSTTLHIPGFLSCGSKHSDLRVEISRDTFEALCKPLLDRAIELLRKALDRSGAGRPDALLLLGGSSRIPILRQRVREELNVEPFTGVDPETCVAQGACIQAGTLTGQVKEVLLLDVMPSSYGIGTLGGVFSTLIEKDTIVPTKKSEVITTTADNQGSIGIDIFHGERKMCADSIYVGHIDLDGIPPAPKGVPQIEVTFDADPNMIIRATAKDLGTGKEREVTIRSPFGLTQVQINMMAKRLARWKERKRVLDALPRATAVQSRIAELLQRSRKFLEHNEVTLLEDRARELALATQNVEQAERILTAVMTTGEAVESIATQVQTRRNLLQERQGLTRKIHQLNTMALGPYSADCDTLRHGISLLKEYDARGAAPTETASLVASVRWSYCDLVAKQLVDLLRQLLSSDEFKGAVRSPKSGYTHGAKDSPMSACLALQPVRVLRSIIAEEVEYADDVCARVGDVVAGDHDVAAAWFLVCRACDWRSHARPPADLPSDQDLADCCISVLLDTLDSEPLPARRKAAAEILVRFLAPEDHYGRLVRAVLRESDAETQICLLRHIDRQPREALAEWFSNSDTETRTQVKSSVPLLERLCGSSDEPCRGFALAALAEMGTSPAWSALHVLMKEADEARRSATYKAVFSATDIESRLAEVTSKAISDACPAIRLLGMETAVSNPTLVPADALLELVRADPSEEIRAKAVSLLAQHYGQLARLDLLAVAVSADEEDTARLALEGVQAVRGDADRDMKRLLALTRKKVEVQKNLNTMDRRFCRSLSRRRPETCSLVDLLITHEPPGSRQC